MDKFNIFDDFFYFFKKIIFYIPIVILILGVIIKINQTPQAKKEPPKAMPRPSPTAPSPGEKLDFNGPLICRYSSKTGSVNVFIKNKQIFGERVTGEAASFYLLKNDCLYSWKKGEVDGRRVCGLGSYISVLTAMFSLTAPDAKDLARLIPKTLSDNLIGSDSAVMEALLKSCKKEAINDLKIFEIPQMPWLRPTFPSSALE